MSILLTGDSGFVGTYVKKHINLLTLCSEAGHRLDLGDVQEVLHFCKNNRFDYVMHLAAKSHVPQSFENPELTYHVNFFGTLNLLNALKASGFKGKFLYVGSSDTYGIVHPSTLPVREDHPQKPRNPYAVSKMAAEGLCYQWSQTESFEIVLVRPFNHIGEGQSDHFAVSNFAKQIAMRKALVEVGDIKVTRDFTDVNDVVRAYLLLLEKGKNGEVYNICSNVERSLEDILEQLIEIAGLKAAVVPLNGRFRMSEQRRIRGSFDKLHAHTGWTPEIPFKETLRSILHGWEKRVLCESAR